MATAEPSLPWEELLKHGRFVRELARTLVRDVNRADDVAQEAWLAVARHRPGALQSVRGWLREVVTNAVRQEHRGEMRREAREQAVATASGSSTPPAAAEAAQLEAQRLLLAAVEQLDPKYRSVVMLRFYDGLPPRRIAAHLGLPVATVRTQLQRAVEQLRTRLDAQSPHGREQWARALAPLLLEATVQLPAALLAAAAVVLLLVGGVWWRIRVEPAEVAAVEGSVAASADVASDGAEAAIAAAVAERASEAVPLGSEAVLRGRVVDRVGRPVAHAMVELHDSSEFVARSNSVSMRQRVVADIDGAFAFESAPFGQWRLFAGKEGWSFAEEIVRINPAHRVSHGHRLVLQPARTVTGVVRDAAGAPVAGAHLVAHDEGDFTWSWREAQSDPDGAFILDAVPARPFWLNVVAEGYERHRRGPIADDVARLEIGLGATEPAVFELLLLEASGAPAADARVSLQYRTDAGPGGQYFRMPRALERLRANSNGRIECRALPPGSYQAFMGGASHLFEPDPIEFTLSPGQSTLLARQAVWTFGSQRLSGELRDGAGAPLVGRVIAAAPAGWQMARVRATTDASGAFEFAAPVGAGKRLALWLEDDERVLADERALLSGVVSMACDPTEPLVLVAENAATLSGVVMQEDGAPVEGARIAVERHGATIDEETPGAISGLDGAFTVRGLAPSPRPVRLRVAFGWPEERIEVPIDRVLAAAEVIEGLTVLVPRLGAIAGRVVDEVGAPVAGALVDLRRPGSGGGTSTGADGSFRLEGVVAGTWTVQAGTARRNGVFLEMPPPHRDSVTLTLSAGETRSGIELVAWSGINARTLRGRIEPQSPFPGFADGACCVLFETVQPSGCVSATDGAFFIGAVPDGACRLGAAWRRLNPISPGCWPVVIAPFQECTPGPAELAISLPAPLPDSVVRARIVAHDGAPPPLDVGLSLGPSSLSDETGPAIAFVGIAPDGSLELHGLHPGAYRLTLSDHDVAREFEVAGPETVDIGELVLPAPHVLVGIVVDSAGAPFAGARIGVLRDRAVLGFRIPPGTDPFDRMHPVVVCDADGRFSLPRPERELLAAWAEGFAPRQLPHDPARVGDEPIVLLPAGDLELTSMPSELHDAAGWRFAVESLESEEARHGYPQEGPRKFSSSVLRSYSCHQIPVGFYAVCFWKGDPNSSSSNEVAPTATIAHEAYRWVVEIKAGQKTTIDLAKEW